MHRATAIVCAPFSRATGAISKNWTLYSSQVETAVRRVYDELMANCPVGLGRYPERWAMGNSQTVDAPVTITRPPPLAHLREGVCARDLEEGRNGGGRPMKWFPRRASPPIGPARPWLRIDRPAFGTTLAMDNAQDRAVKGTSTGHIDVTLFVPSTASSLVFGLLLNGGGEATARNLKIEAVRDGAENVHRRAGIARLGVRAGAFALSGEIL